MLEEELYRAVCQNDVGFVRVIIQNSVVDLNYISPDKDNDGSPLLVLALNKGHIRIARQLIMAGADVNLGNNGFLSKKFSSMMPLHIAIRLEMSPYSICRENEDKVVIDGLVELLLTKGAKPNQKSLLGATPLENFIFWYDVAPPEKSKSLLFSLMNAGADEGCLYDHAHKNMFREIRASNTELRTLG